MFVLTLLSLIAVASADQLVSGDALRVYYDGYGYWNDADASAGLQALHDGAWLDWTWPGNPYMVWSVAYADEAGTTTYYADSFYYGTNMTVSGETDASNAIAAMSHYTYTAGSLSVTKTESWLVADRVMRVDLALTNTGDAALNDLQLLFAVDPDPDANTTYDYSTLNDVRDVDGDGTDDWVESVSPSVGYTLGFGACEPENSALGHYSDWTYATATDTALSDEDGGQADDAMGLSWTYGGVLAAEESVNVRLIVVLADSAADAEEGWLDSVGACDDCDADGDGADMAICGGDDCEPDDSSAHPGGADTWYDGIDGDCSGGSDYDADGDGYDADAYGGDDCGDTDPAVHPGASEIWYDGIDSDCSGGSDDDADGDGYDADTYGGDDCDDTDPTVSPGASEIWYDGLDSDCSGGSDDDADGDGHDSDAYGGDDCDDTNPSAWPGAAEIPYDGLDEDCAGDQGEYDADGDGLDAVPYGGTDCDDTDPSTWPGAADAWYDGVDSDCAGNDDDDADGDGHDAAAYAGDDCDDTDPSVYAGAVDPENDGVDQNCDGQGGPDTGSGYLSVKAGCGCSSTPSGGVAEVWVALAGLLLLRRRRPR